MTLKTRVRHLQEKAKPDPEAARVRLVWRLLTDPPPKPRPGEKVIKWEDIERGLDYDTQEPG